MNDLIDFLTSDEIIIVYIIAAFACLICFIVYLVEKNNEKLRQRHNTKELNKLVEEIREKYPEEFIEESNIEPTIEVLEETNNNETKINQEPMVIGPIDVEETIDLTEIVEKVKEQEELEYTDAEPDRETARMELKKIEDQLIIEEEVNQYEEEQERSAIISIDELLSKGKEMVEANEVTQYEDEGNEPISIQDLEKQINKQAAIYTEPFVLADVVPEKELQEGIEEAFEQVVTETKEVLHMDDMMTIKPETVNPVIQTEVKKFKSSPIISPIFGIEKDTSRENALALENTANYDKLDAAIRNNNEFYMTMSELEEK